VRQLQEARDPLQEVGRLHHLGDELVHEGVRDGAPDQVVVGEGREHDAGHARVQLAGQVEQLDAVHAGHLEVRDDGVHRRRVEDVDGLAPRGRGDDLGPGDAGLDDGLEGAQDVGLVIHQQEDPGPRRRGGNACNGRDGKRQVCHRVALQVVL